MITTLQTRFTALAAVLLMLGCSAEAQTNNSFCWMRSTTRGVGGLPGSCPSGTQSQDGLCYTNCAGGYEGVGPVCWQQCPGGFTNVGVSCQKPGDVTSPGYPWQFGDPLDLSGAQARCQRDHPQGCFQSGLIFYPNCPANYHNNGANICTANCPSGMADSGGNCLKQTYGRGVGVVPGCGSGMETDAGLCYPSCPAGSSGVGPTCWTNCPSNFPVQCGAACAISQSACTQAVGDMVLNTAGVAINLLSMFAGGPGVSTAVKEAATAGRSAMVDVLTHTAGAGESLLMSQAKAYSGAFAKQFVKTMVKSQFEDRNLFFRAVKTMRSNTLRELNSATGDFGTTQSSGTFDLNNLTALDPTGIATMVTSFTQYGPCNATDDFTVTVTSGQDASATAGGSAVVLPTSWNGQGTVSLTLTAQNPMMVTRVTSPSMTNCSIQPTTDCIGKHLQPGQTCNISAAVSAPGSLLDGELRIYTDNYPTIPYPVSVVNNLAVSPNGTMIPSATSITDNKGIVWTLDDQGLTYENGVADGGANVSLLLYYNGVVYGGTKDYGWWMHTSAGWSSYGPNDPRGGVSIPPAASITDASGVNWTVVNGKSYENGVWDFGDSITLLLSYNGQIYADTTQYGWYVHNSGGWSSLGTKDPRTSLADPPVCQADRYTSEAVNLTSITGVWALNDSQSSKVKIQSNGQVSGSLGSVSASVRGLTGRAFQVGSTLMTLDETGDHLTGVPNPGAISIKRSGLVLDTTGAVTDDGALIEQWGSNGGSNQSFAFQMLSDGAYQIVIAQSQKVFEAQDPTTSAGNVFQATPSGSINQEFRVEPVGDESQGWYRIISVATGQYLTVDGNSTSQGAKIVQAAWSGGDNQQFKLNPGSRAVRRPTGAGCPDGQTLFDGLCYDVAPGWGLDTPGIVGLVCPADWRDDGTSCWPPWTGVFVSSQADPQGSTTMRHPIVVTSCSSYAALQGQSCPANFTNVGGIGSCSCQAQPTSRNIQTIGSSIPKN